MKNIKTIEGFGLPGAGKSTCMAKLKSDPQLLKSIGIYLRKEGDTKFLDIPYAYSNKKVDVFSEGITSLSYLIVRPILFLSVIKSLFIFRCNRNFVSVLRSLIQALYSRSKIIVSESENHLMVLDEGLIQFIGSLVVNSSTNNQVPKSLIKHVLSNYIQVMIYFDIDYNNAISRIKKRNDDKSRFDKMEDENALLNLEKMERTFTLCIEMANNLGIPFLVLKKGNSVNENVDSILKFLELKSTK